MASKKSRGEWVPFVYLPDAHGDHVYKPAWAVVLEFIKDFEPKDRIMGGDVMDLRPLRKGASIEERAESMEPDFEAGMRLLRDVMPTRWIKGNHDDRLWELARDDQGPLGDLGRYLSRRVEDWCSKWNCTLYEYSVDTRAQLNENLFAIHGFFHNMHTAKKTAETYPGCTMAGHTHKADYYRTYTLDLRECYLGGCLCDLLPNYAKRRGASLANVHGFLWGEYHTTKGLYDVNQAICQFGEWRIAGKTYK